MAQPVGNNYGFRTLEPSGDRVPEAVEVTAWTSAQALPLFVSFPEVEAARAVVPETRSPWALAGAASVDVVGAPAVWNSCEMHGFEAFSPVAKPNVKTTCGVGRIVLPRTRRRERHGARRRHAATRSRGGDSGDSSDGEREPPGDLAGRLLPHPYSFQKHRRRYGHLPPTDRLFVFLALPQWQQVEAWLALQLDIARARGPPPSLERLERGDARRRHAWNSERAPT